MTQTLRDPRNESREELLMHALIMAVPAVKDEEPRA